RPVAARAGAAQGGLDGEPGAGGHLPRCRGHRVGDGRAVAALAVAAQGGGAAAAGAERRDLQQRGRRVRAERTPVLPRGGGRRLRPRGGSGGRGGALGRATRAGHLARVGGL
ncbi:unnamed protein product, partial [Prorocentrum cordatum]